MLSPAMVVKGSFYEDNTLAWSNDPGISHHVWLDGSVVKEAAARACIKTEVFAHRPNIRIEITSVFGGTMTDIETIADYLDRSILSDRERVTLDIWTKEQGSQVIALPEYAELRQQQ